MNAEIITDAAEHNSPRSGSKRGSGAETMQKGERANKQSRCRRADV